MEATLREAKRGLTSEVHGLKRSESHARIGRGARPNTSFVVLCWALCRVIPVCEEVGAALGAFVTGAVGPTHSKLSTVFSQAGYGAAAPYDRFDDQQQPNKEDRVNSTVRAAIRSPQRSRDLVDGLLAQYRAPDSSGPATMPTRRSSGHAGCRAAQAATRIDWELTDDGELHPLGVAVTSVKVGPLSMTSSNACGGPPMTRPANRNGQRDARVDGEVRPRRLLVGVSPPRPASTSSGITLVTASGSTRRTSTSASPAAPRYERFSSRPGRSLACATSSPQRQGTGHGRTLPAAVSPATALARRASLQHRPDDTFRTRPPDRPLRAEPRHRKCARQRLDPPDGGGIPVRPPPSYSQHSNKGDAPISRPRQVNATGRTTTATSPRSKVRSATSPPPKPSARSAWHCPVCRRRQWNRCRQRCDRQVPAQRSSTAINNNLRPAGGVTVGLTRDGVPGSGRQKVFDPDGDQIGRIKGSKVFGPDGRYVGTVTGSRLVDRSTDSAAISPDPSCRQEPLQSHGCIGAEPPYGRRARPPPRRS